MQTRKQAPPASDLDPERELTYHIAQAVFELRTAQGMRQTELAELAGTKQPAISRLERAAKMPSLPILLRIAKALGVRLVVRFEKL